MGWSQEGMFRWDPWPFKGWKMATGNYPGLKVNRILPGDRAKAVRPPLVQPHYYRWDSFSPYPPLPAGPTQSQSWQEPVAFDSMGCSLVLFLGPFSILPLLMEAFTDNIRVWLSVSLKDQEQGFPPRRSGLRIWLQWLRSPWRHRFDSRPRAVS